MKKAGRYLLTVFPVLLGLGIQALCGFMGSLLCGFLYGFKAAMNGETVSEAEIQAGIMASYNEIIIYVLIISQLIALLVFTIWYRAQNKKNVKRKVTQIVHGKTIGWVVLWGIGLQAFTSVALQLVYLAAPEAVENLSELMETVGIGEMGLVSMLATVILAPIAEEVIFRGVTLNLAKKAGAPFLVANGIQALMFGIYHANLVQGAYAFVIGLVLGYAAHKYGSLYPAILLHLAYNLSATLLNAISSSLPGTILVYVLFVGIGVLFIAAGAWLFQTDEKAEAVEANLLTQEKSEIQQGEML